LFVHYLFALLGICACYVGAFLVMPLTFGAIFTVYHEVFNSPVNAPPATCHSAGPGSGSPQGQRW
jgi:hypothetical protein